MKIAFKTFGCKANSVDTDALYHEARRRGLEIVEEDESADAYVINSCTVTGAADRDARVQANRYKRRNPAALVGVIGCYAQVAKEELLSLPEVDFVVGTANKNRILDHFFSTWQGAGSRPERDQVESPIGFLPELFPGSRNARASVKIQDGCNFSCSFCIIPQARGRSRSLPVDVVVKQIEDAHQSGFREVVLTGIHIAHYGWDQGMDLMRLIHKILQAPEGPRIRISTLDPFELPDELIALVAKHPRLCPHFHIALQSGSDRILKSMRRIYAAREFVEVTKKIEAASSDVFIGVDVIVGFPGETEEDFQETVKCLEESFWAKLHVFPFSARQGTRAAELADPVPSTQITNRSRLLREMSDSRQERFLKSQIGKEHEILLEKPSAKFPGFWLGHTENYLPTVSLAPEGITRETARASIEKLSRGKLWTSPIKKREPEVSRVSRQQIH